jgi:hypothetical protein
MKIVKHLKDFTREFYPETIVFLKEGRIKFIYDSFGFKIYFIMNTTIDIINGIFSKSKNDDI